MATYLVIIYLSFLVFLVIIGSLNSILIPALESVSAAEATGSGPTGIAGVGDIAAVDIDAYTLVFFHTALVQAVFSGFVAGKMGEGSVKDGAKHATVLFTIAYVVFLLLP
ncbi:hypothetical protein [Haladaptatus sp. NG-WS-4]